MRTYLSKFKAKRIVFVLFSLGIVALISLSVRLLSFEVEPLPGVLPDGTFRITKPKDHEITMAVVEVRNGTSIADQKWVERLTSPSTSLSVTVERPALLVTFWWGDGDASLNHTATPNNDFTIIDSLTMKGGLIQCIVAVRGVMAGTHDVTWTSESGEGAQVWLVAVDEPAGGGTPELGGHVLGYHREGTGGTSITTEPIVTAADKKAGSVILIASGHYILSTESTPTDSEGNSYIRIGTGHTYTDWPRSGTQLHAAYPQR